MGLTLKQAHMHTSNIVQKVNDLNNAIAAATRVGMNVELVTLKSSVATEFGEMVETAAVHPNVRCDMSILEQE